MLWSLDESVKINAWRQRGKGILSSKVGKSKTFAANTSACLRGISNVMLFVDALKCCVTCNFQLVVCALCECGYTIILKVRKINIPSDLLMLQHLWGKTAFDCFQVDWCTNVLQPLVTIKQKILLTKRGLRCLSKNHFPLVSIFRRGRLSCLYIFYNEHE